MRWEMSFVEISCRVSTLIVERRMSPDLREKPCFRKPAEMHKFRFSLRRQSLQSESARFVDHW